jgi:glycosyltransferase involved in cell wall biosynthesis
MDGPHITVAVATCGRPASLARCTRALAAEISTPAEVIVVDQEPSSGARRAVEASGLAGVRYLEQPRLGVSASRNLALAVASGAIVAVTDDDCVPDPGWLTALTAAFDRAPAPVAVTGPILPLGPRPQGAHAVSVRGVEPAADYAGRMLPWLAGSGGNFAALRTVLRRYEGWDTRLGPGTPGQAAEDSELLYRLLRGGGVVRYEPAAVVRHEWQTWERRLATRRSYAYGIGALCGIWLRRGDPFAARMLGAYAHGHARALANAVIRRDRATAQEHARALGGLMPGVNYGLCA